MARKGRSEAETDHFAHEDATRHQALPDGHDKRSQLSFNHASLRGPRECVGIGGCRHGVQHPEAMRRVPTTTTCSKMMDKRARRRPTALPCANATACLPIK